MPSEKGDFCLRCGMKTVAHIFTEDGKTFKVWVCPVGHGEQSRKEAEAEQTT